MKMQTDRIAYADMRIYAETKRQNTCY